MDSPFAALERRVNAVVGKRLANATATLGNETVSGLFDATYADALGYGGGSRPVFQFDGEQVFAVVEDDPITLRSASGAILFNGTVASVEPDGSGWLLLHLHRSAP
ncbi:hypothetical protein FNU76_10205 [Chitinimonas arctica]|uniref:Uncharacterized protein n=1 Tax=Chitinimonas arctica TaxID=2594795 RepID=A0A516SEW9_9NEIS|nr:hypothetical protein [Chitinimonas arctica]QDQ26706.1 hypothetical protein FNU76_10205 [Chitinimonas arctica]